MTVTAAAPGRPLRALAVLLLVTLVWFASRLPGVERRFLAALAAQAAVPVAAPAGVSAVPPTATNNRHPREGGGPSPGGATLPPTLAIVADAARKTRSSRAEPTPGPSPPLPAGTLITPVTPGMSQPLSPPIDMARDAAATLAPAPADAPPPGFDLATRAYAALAARDARSAARLFGEALARAGTPAPPYAQAWQGEQNRLNRRWSGDAYSLRRDAGRGNAAASLVLGGGAAANPVLGGGAAASPVLGGGAAASPVLGGGQSGGTLAYALDPLARRPVAIIARIYAAHTAGGGIDGGTAQAAAGVRWQVTPGIGIAAERLIAIGSDTASDWNLRVAGGGRRPIGRAMLDAYGEAGVRGNGDAYAGGQARAMAEIARAGPLVVSAGPAAWGSIQRAQTTVGRLDVGAGVTIAAPYGVTISADWRWRVAGNAAPASGPALTVATAF